MILQQLPPPTRESELLQPFQLQYMYPHNLVTVPTGAIHQHVQITTRSMDLPIAGDPDYIFKYNGALAGIIELKTFGRPLKNRLTTF